MAWIICSCAASTSCEWVGKGKDGRWLKVAAQHRRWHTACARSRRMKWTPCAEKKVMSRLRLLSTKGSKQLPPGSYTMLWSPPLVRLAAPTRNCGAREGGPLLSLLLLRPVLTPFSRLVVLSTLPESSPPGSCMNLRSPLSRSAALPRPLASLQVSM